MSDLIWWTIFSVLVLLLFVFIAQLCYSVISDVCCEKKPALRKTSDIEDLTRYHTDFRTVFRDLQCKDEADKGSLANLLINYHTSPDKKETEQKNEEESNTKINGYTSTTNEEYFEDNTRNITDEKEQRNENEGNTIIEIEDHTKEETMDLTEEEKEVLEKILGIKGEVDIYAKQIPYCLGGKQHLQYFEMNQKFLMNLINLSSIECKNEKLKKRKQMVSLYIQECQNELKMKAEENV